MKQQFKVAILLSHPIHYLLGWAREIGHHSNIEVDVLLESRFGLEPAFDPTMQREVRWHNDNTVLDGLNYEFLTESYNLTGRFRFPFVKSLVSHLRAQNYDGIVIRGYERAASYASILSALRTSTPILFHGETNLRKNNANLVTRLGKDAAIRSILSAVDVCFPIGSESHQFYTHYGVSDERLFLTPYSVDNQRLFELHSQWMPAKADIRRTWQIEDDKPVILCVGKLIERKRPLDLVRAFMQIQDQAYLVIVGDGPQMPEIAAFIQDNNLANVRLLGFKGQAELPQIYAAADIFAFPSGYEPWGLVINEAMCFGLPIVVADGVISATDLVQSRGTGFVYTTGEIDSLAAYLSILIDDVDLRTSMGKKSREVIKGWSYQESAEAVFNALHYIHPA